MKNYTKLIKENQSEFKDHEQLEDFLDAYMQEGDEISDKEDDIHEYVDGLIPVYDHQILDEWRENERECKGMAEKQGLINGETDVYKIMQSDLRAMYYEELNQDFQALLDLLDD